MRCRSSPASAWSTSTPRRRIRRCSTRSIPTAAWRWRRCPGAHIGGRRVVAVSNPANGPAAMAAFGGDGAGDRPAGGDPAGDHPALRRQDARDALNRCPEAMSCRSLMSHAADLAQARRAGGTGRRRGAGAVAGAAAGARLGAPRQFRDDGAAAGGDLRPAAAGAARRRGGAAAGRLPAAAAGVGAGAALAGGEGRRPAARRTRGDGVSRAAPRHQAGAGGGGRDDAGGDRAQRAAGDDRGGDGAGRHAAHQAAGDELRAAVLPGRDRRGL